MEKRNEQLEKEMIVNLATGETRRGDILRIDHRDELFAGLEESRRRAERRDRNWQRAQKLWHCSFITLVIAALFGVPYLLMMTLNRLSDLGRISFHINPFIVTACGMIMVVFAVAAVVQFIVAKVLERG